MPTLSASSTAAASTAPASAAASASASAWLLCIAVTLSACVLVWLACWALASATSAPSAPELCQGVHLQGHHHELGAQGRVVLRLLHSERAVYAILLYMCDAHRGAQPKCCFMTWGCRHVYCDPPRPHQAVLRPLSVSGPNDGHLNAYSAPEEIVEASTDSAAAAARTQHHSGSQGGRHACARSHHGSRAGR